MSRNRISRVAFLLLMFIGAISLACTNPPASSETSTTTADATTSISGTTTSIDSGTTTTPPVGYEQSVVTDEDESLVINLSGDDADGGTLIFTVVTTPTHGTLGGTVPDLIYTPDADYNGADSFTFKVNDGTIDSNPATVSITINSVNDVPVADAQTVSTNEDTAALITLTGSDIDGDTLTLPSSPIPPTAL